MKIKSEKAYTGVDIAISIVVIFIFVSVISFLVYKVNSNTKEVEIKTQALDIALESIEQMKGIDFTEIENLGNEEEEEYTGNQIQGLTQNGFERSILVEDYASISGNSEVMPGFVKKVTVRIEYKYKNNTNKVELSTIRSK